MAYDLAHTTQARTQELADHASRTAAGARDYAADALESVKDAVGEGRDKFRRSGPEVTGIGRAGPSNLQNVRDTVNATVGSVSSGIGDLKDRAAEFAGDASVSFQEKLSEATSALSQTATDSKQVVQELLNNARDRVSDAGQRAS